MKKLLLIPLLAFNVNAEFTKSESELCDSFENMSRLIMKSRQAGTPMRDLIKRAKGNEAIIATIVDAFKEPRWSSLERVKRSVDDFANDSYKVCYQQFRG